MTEQSYEAKVEALERRYATGIESIARSALNHAERANYDAEEAREHARTAVETALFDSPSWVDVKATDISDIAYEAVNRAYDER